MLQQNEPTQTTQEENRIAVDEEMKDVFEAYLTPETQQAVRHFSSIYH